MNLKHLSDRVLVETAEKLASEERRIFTELLWYLHEIEARGILVREGYSSMHDFCMRHLKYSSGCADRRVKSMQALKAMPEIEKDLRSGDLNMTHLSMARSAFQKEKTSLAEKREIISEIRGKSKKKAERILAAHYPEMNFVQEVERPLSARETEIRFTASLEMLERFEKLKEEFSHRLADQSYRALFDYLSQMGMKEVLKRTEGPVRKVSKTKKAATAAEEPDEIKTESVHAAEKTSDPAASQSFIPPAEKEKKHSRYLSRAEERELRQRDESCTYISPSGVRCNSRHFLQNDHIIDFARGGPTELKNLRRYCHAHNQMHAMDSYGAEKMRAYHPV